MKIFVAFSLLLVFVSSCFNTLKSPQSINFLLPQASAEYVVKTRENFLQFRNDCITELRIPETLVEQYRKWHYPNDDITKCYLKCVFTKFGLFDTSGFNLENIHQQLAGSGAKLDHNDDLHAKIESCIDKNDQGSDACEWAYRGGTCFFRNNLQLVQQSVASPKAE